ncbi:MAG: hypothetical protein ABJF04_22300 [Reichenbachiella sp.]|uniref:hypothetical protein n=1 Tax=Reichenbachiella sp. TaxID=2184521 RepID=UPI0032678B0D
MSQTTVNLFDMPIEQLFSRVKTNFRLYQYDYRKHTVLLNDDRSDAVGQIRLPLHLSLDDQLNITGNETLVLYLSIESGHAAICVMQGKSNVYHTTFSAYMTRKKQGVSQIKYLNKKGKSRAGSRVRLAKTIEFFERINTALIRLFEEHEIERIALNCNATLIPYLHNSKVACPFDKKDSRLYKIPLHIPQSNFTNLDKAVKKLMAPILFYESEHELMINKALN